MLVFLSVLVARMLDPAAIILCAGSAPMIGAYRVAVPVGALLYSSLQLGLVDEFSWLGLLTSATAGAVLSASGLFLWQRIPKRFKRAMTSGQAE